MTDTTPFSASQGAVATATAVCPTGEKILGGGASISVSSQSQLSRAGLRETYPSAPNAWTGTLVITSGLFGATATINVYAICTV